MKQRGHGRSAGGTEKCCCCAKGATAISKGRYGKTERALAHKTTFKIQNCTTGTMAPPVLDGVIHEYLVSNNKVYHENTAAVHTPSVHTPLTSRRGAPINRENKKTASLLLHPTNIPGDYGTPTTSFSRFDSTRSLVTLCNKNSMLTAAVMSSDQTGSSSTVFCSLSAKQPMCSYISDRPRRTPAPPAAAAACVNRETVSSGSRNTAGCLESRACDSRVVSRLKQLIYC